MRPYRSAFDWPGLSARGARAHGGLLAALGILILGFVFLLTALTAYLALSATHQAVVTLAGVSASQGRTVVQARLADDAGTQRAAAEETLARVLDRSAIAVETEQLDEGGQRYVRWTITPHPTGFTAAAMPGLIEGLDGLQRSFAADERIGAGGVTTDGSLTTTLADIQRRVGAEQGASLVPLALIGIIGLVALGQVARLVASARSPELGLIRSRGSSLRRLGLTAAVEATSVALPAAAVGAGAGILLIAVLYPSIGVDRMLWAIAAGIVIVTAAIVGFSTVATARTASLSAPAFAGRGRTAVGAVSLVLVILVAALSFLQFRVYGSPLVMTESGRPRVEPFIAAAPALLLLAVVILGLALFAPTARLAEVAVARSRGARPSLPVRQVARRVGLHAVSVTVVALAVGAIVLASTYSATLARASGIPSALRTGADLAVGASGGTLPPLADIAATTGVTAAAPVLSVSAKLGSATVDVVALPAGRLDGLMNDLDGAVDVAALGRAIAAASPGLPLGAAGEVSVDVSVAVGQPSIGEVYFEGVPLETIDRADVVVRLVVADQSGIVSTIALDPVRDPVAPAEGEPDSVVQATRTATLPEGAARLIGIEVHLVGGFASRDHTVTIGSITGVESLDGTWGLAATSPEEDVFGVAFPTAGEGATAVIPGLSTSQRVMLVAPGATDEPVRAIASEQLAERLALGVGDTVTVSSGLFGEDFELEVAGITPAIPGTTGGLGLLLDLDRLEVGLLGTDRPADTTTGGYPGGGVTRYWLSSADPAATRAALPEGLEVAATRVSDAEPTSTAIALWLGALGALLLAAATLLAGNGMVSRARSGELRVLRALGMSRREIAAARRLEIVVVVAFGVLLGAASGVVSAVLTVSDLARSATIGLPATLDVPLLVDPVPLAILLGATLVVFAAVAVAAGRQATARARLESREGGS